jgi:DNA-binding NtrC family response regulator
MQTPTAANAYTPMTPHECLPAAHPSDDTMHSGGVLAMQSASVAVVEDGPGCCDRRPRSEGQIIARSAAMRDILDLVRKIAAADVTVLILGDIGVEIARAAMLAEGPETGQACVAGLLGSAHPHADSEMVSVPLAGGLEAMESTLIHEVIRRCRGNKAAAARSLKLHRRTLYRLLEG